MPELDLTGVEDIQFERFFDGPISQNEVNTLKAGLESTINAFARRGSKDPRGEARRQVLNTITQFRQEFRNTVGREANSEEIGRFSTEFLQPTGTDFENQARLENAVSQFTQRFSQPFAEAESERQLEEQVSGAQDLAEQFRQQQEASLGRIEPQLADFAARLSERVLPQTIQRLQQQGLLNTGGLNQAIAGQQADIQRGVQGQLIQQRLANEQAANQIAFAGQAAPLQFQRSLALSRLPQQQQNLQAALQRQFQFGLQQQNLQNQIGFLNAQRAGQPGFGTQLGRAALGIGLQAAGTGIGGLLGGPAGAAIGGSLAGNIQPGSVRQAGSGSFEPFNFQR